MVGGRMCRGDAHVCDLEVARRKGYWIKYS